LRAKEGNLYDSHLREEVGLLFTTAFIGTDPCPFCGQYLLRPLFYSRCLVAQDERDPSARNKARNVGHCFTTTANW